MSASPATDYGRWSDPTRLAEDWDERARFAAQFIRPGLAILDIGCGGMGVERIFKPSLYRPADVVARDERTQIVDLNAGPLRADLLSGIELVTMLGVFEYLVDPAATMKAIAAAGKPLLCSYNAADLGPAVDRASNGWLIDWPAAEFEQAAREAGFRIAWRYLFQDRQFLYLLVPEGFDAAAVTRETRLFGDRVREGRPRLVVCGFFARGNCGDEALLQVIYESFADAFDITISVDEHGAAPRFWDWYPYNQCQVIHQGNLSALLQPAAGLLVGGGGLPLGFDADQVLCARSAGTPVALAGTDFVHPLTKGKTAEAAAAAYFDLFDYIGLRSTVATERARGIHHRITHGADWALNLVTDEAPSVDNRPERALVVLREFPLQMASFDYVERIEGLLRGLRERRLEPVFMPFCPEDVRFLHMLGLDRVAPRIEEWSNPRRAKQFIAQSGLVVSVGRLHPMIFAVSTRTPVAQLHPPLTVDIDSFGVTKIQTMGAEFGVPYHRSVESLLTAIDRGLEPSPADKLAVGRHRLNSMIADLRALFLEKRRPRRKRLVIR